MLVHDDDDVDSVYTIDCNNSVYTMQDFTGILHSIMDPPDQHIEFST